MSGQWNLTKDQRRELAKSNAKFGKKLEEFPLAPNAPPTLLRAWRSRDFLVQLYLSEYPEQPTRLSVSRTIVDATGRWVDGISWDDLQRLKAEAGFGDCDALEVFPADKDLVNVANMRHLWLFPDGVGFKWYVAVPKKPEVTE